MAALVIIVKNGLQPKIDFFYYSQERLTSYYASKPFYSSEQQLTVDIAGQPFYSSEERLTAYFLFFWKLLTAYYASKPFSLVKSSLWLKTSFFIEVKNGWHSIYLTTFFILVRIG